MFLAPKAPKFITKQAGDRKEEDNEEHTLSSIAHRLSFKRVSRREDFAKSLMKKAGL